MADADVPAEAPDADIRSGVAGADDSAIEDGAIEDSKAAANGSTVENGTVENGSAPENGEEVDDTDKSGDLLVREGDIAADYLERLLDIVDYDGDIDLDVENDRAVVAIVGSRLQSLIGARGETLDALQELTRLAVQQKTGVRSRLMLDISGHRSSRRQELASLARSTAQRVLDGREPARLAPMNPFERKVVHDTITSIDGVRSESEGEEPNRRVVVLLDS